MECPVKVLVGSDRRIYYVHPGVLSSCNSSSSSALNARVSERWKDTGDGMIDWTDFDERTVECVLSYLYTGDYYYCGPRSRSTSESTASPSPSPSGQEGKCVHVDHAEGKSSVTIIVYRTRLTYRQILSLPNRCYPQTQTQKNTRFLRLHYRMMI